MRDEKEQISDKVLKMKFMQRPKEEQLKKKMLAEQQRKAKESHWVLKEESSNVITLEESILFDKFTPGRRSFKGFNPSIETINAERKAESEGKGVGVKRVRKEDLVVPTQISSGNKMEPVITPLPQQKAHKQPQQKKPRKK